MKKGLSILLFVFCVSFSVAAQQQEYNQLQTVSLSIQNKLQELKQEYNSIQTQLIEASSNLKISKEQQALLEQQLTSSSASLEAINQELNSSLAAIERYKQKTKNLLTISIVLLLVLVIRFCLMTLGFILYAKGIKLPRWLDILL